MEKNKTLKVGELVQIWDDAPDEICGPTITGHGSVGYLVERSVHKDTNTKGTMWKVICFGQDPSITYNVHEEWLSPIHSSKDVRSTTSDIKIE